MGFENVSLWFAKDIKDEIVVVTNAKQSEEYMCPVCESRVVPKGLKDGAVVTPHFAHFDKEKCNSEHMIHWWFKNKFISVGDRFKIKTKDVKSFICKSVLVEQVYKIKGETYKPDVTIECVCGEVIFFEMAYSNKKKPEEYIGIWSEIGNMVVEVDIRNLIGIESTNTYNAIYYDGKIINKNKKTGYQKNIGDYIDKHFNFELRKTDIERIKRLNWFWIDMCNYRKKKINVDDLVYSIEGVNVGDFEVVAKMIEKPSCLDICKDVIKARLKIIEEEFKLKFDNDKYLVKTSSDYASVYDISSLKEKLICSKFVGVKTTIAEVFNSFDNSILKYEYEKISTPNIKKVKQRLNKLYNDIYITYSTLDYDKPRFFRHMFGLDMYSECYYYEVCLKIIDNDNTYGTRILEIRIDKNYEKNLLTIHNGDNKISLFINDETSIYKEILAICNSKILDFKNTNKAKLWGGLPTCR